MLAIGRRSTTPAGSSSEDVLPPGVLQQVQQIGGADILVGIPCFNNEETVGGVVTAVEAGLRKHFPGFRCVICASDGGSTDRTREVVMEAGVGERAEDLLVPKDTAVPGKLCFEYRGPSGKGTAVRSIVEVSSRLGARACAVVDADLRSLTPYWLDRMLTPVVHHGYGFVAPLYARHRFDGTITNSLAYPITTALYGVRIRQPIGGEFAFTGKLAALFAGQDVWDTEVARFGVDLWMTTVAVVEGYRTCQARLGAKLHDPKDPAQDLGPMFRQVVGTLFTLAGRYRARWTEVSNVRTPPTFGFRADYSAEPIPVSVPRLTWKFVDGYVHHHDLWGQVLSEGSMEGVERAVGQAAEDRGRFVLDTELWTKIVYDFLVAYNAGDVDPAVLLDSLIPLYFARTASFVEEVRDLSDEEAETRIEQAVDVALEMKDYLRDRWKAPVPSSPPPPEEPRPSAAVETMASDRAR